MPLAGKMKLNHFLMLAGGSGLLAAGGVGYGLYSNLDPTPPAIEAKAPPSVARPVPRRTADKVLLAKLRQLGGQPIDGSKAKDRLGPDSPKVNLYKDEGHDGVNRLKVDWDRDDRWDEKWTFEEGGIVRQVSSEDDENYGKVLTWDGRSWTADGASAGPAEAVGTPREAPPASTDAAGVVGPGPAIQSFLLQRRGTDLGTNKIKDASQGTPWKVNLYQDDGFTVVNRAKIDLDRDDKWDEKWTFSDDGVSKKVAPNDDEDYTETWVYDGARWSKEK